MPPRAHLIGLDKPTATPLRLAPDPLQALRQQASTHERNRLESIAELLGLIGLLGMKQVLTGREAVTVRGAMFQWGEGSRADRTVGAHCLPGHVKFNGHALHEMPGWTPKFLEEHGLKPLALDSKLRNVSARTELTDVVVNETDSLLEKMDTGRGFKFRLGGALSQLMERVLFESARTPGALASIVAGAMSHYRFGAGLACEERLEWLQQQLRVEKAPAKLEVRRRQAAIVEQYLFVLEDGSFVPYFTTLPGILELLRDVVRKA
jgi:hypothetical protein